MLIKDILHFQKNLLDFCERYEKIYLYGAGEYASSLNRYLQLKNIVPSGAFVSKLCGQKMDNILVREFGECIEDGAGLILSLREKNHIEIKRIVGDKFVEILSLPDEFYPCIRQAFFSIMFKGENCEWHICSDVTKIFDFFKEKTIVLQRNSGIGDVLSLEPLCRKFKKMGFKVGVVTKYPNLFLYNPYIDFLSMDDKGSFFYDNAIFICEDVAHEMSPFKSMLDAYIDTARIFFPQISLSDVERIPSYDDTLIREHDPNGKSICLNAEATEWDSRIYPHDRMRAFAEYLKKTGYEIYEVGSNHDNYLGVGYDCYGMELHDTIKLMSMTDMYIGLDNGLMHLAQAIRLPIFVFFGCTCPNFRVHDWSRARVMWKNVDELPCAACYHRRHLPCTKAYCLKDKVSCLDWSVDEAIEAFKNLKYNQPPVIKTEMMTPLLM